MKLRKASRLALVALAIPAAAAAADETHIGSTVADIELTKSIPPGSLGLKNAAQSKLASQRNLVVTGEDPRFTVSGKVFCRQGARLTAVQAVIGKVVVNQTELFSIQTYGQSAKLTNVAGQIGAFADIPVKLDVTRRASNSLVDLTFNPARAYEDKLKAYVAKGNTAAEYLRETQAFDMEVTVNFIAWCRMDANANSVLAGKTYPGVVSRKVPVTVLYNGDPAIIDGPAARATTSTRKAEDGPPAHNR